MEFAIGRTLVTGYFKKEGLTREINNVLPVMTVDRSNHPKKTGFF